MNYSRNCSISGILLLLLILQTSCGSERAQERKERRATRLERKSPGERENQYPFNMNGKPFELCYIVDGLLYFKDLGSGENMLFPGKSPLFNAAFSKEQDLMYFTTEVKDSLRLNRAYFYDTMVILHRMADLGEPVSVFCTEPDKWGSNIQVYGDTVLIGYDYNSSKRKFESSIQCVVNKEYEELTLENFVDRRRTEIASEKRDKNSKFMRSVMRIKMHGFQDMLRMANNDSIELSRAVLLRGGGITLPCSDEQQVIIDERAYLLSIIEGDLWMTPMKGINDTIPSMEAKLIAEEVDFFRLR